MTEQDIPDWLIAALTIIAGFSVSGVAAWLRVILPAKRLEQVLFIGRLAGALLDVIGGNVGQCKNATPQQQEEEKINKQIMARHKKGGKKWWKGIIYKDGA